jgi:hypothetical protein
LKIYSTSKNNISKDELYYEKLFKLPYSSTIKVKNDITDIVIDNSEDRSFILEVNSRDLEFDIDDPTKLLVYLTQENDEKNQIRFYVPNTIKESFHKNLVKIRNKLSGQELEINVSFNDYKPFSIFSFLSIFDVFGIFSYIFSSINLITSDFIAIILLTGVTLYIAKSYFVNNIEVKLIYFFLS